MEEEVAMTTVFVCYGTEVYTNRGAFTSSECIQALHTGVSAV